MKKTFLIILLFRSLCVFEGFAQTNPKRTLKHSYSGKEVVLRLETGENNPRNSEGDFITLIDGRILFIYTHYTGQSGADWGNAYLASRFSLDNGKTWSKESKIEIQQEGKNNVMSVSLIRLPNGSIALFNLRIDGEFKCSPWIRISNDEGNTWGKPWKCIPDREGYFQVNNDRVILLENGRLLMPVVEHNVSHQKWDSIASRGIIWNFWSDNMGISWNSGNSIDYPVNSPAGTIMQEPGVVEFKNGHNLMYMRTSSHVQFISFSKDQGVTWSPAERSNIPSPRSPAVIKRIPSTGDLIMVWNNNGGNEKRSPLSVAISRNNGESWEKTKNIEDDPNGSFSYPAIHFTNNDVLVAYCAKGLSATYISRLSLDWIYK